MYCPYCGAIAVEKARFCTACGKALPALGAAAGQGDTRVTPGAAPREEDRTSARDQIIGNSGASLAIWKRLALVPLLLVLAALAVIYLHDALWAPRIREHALQWSLGLVALGLVVVVGNTVLRSRQGRGPWDTMCLWIEGRPWASECVGWGVILSFFAALGGAIMAVGDFRFPVHPSAVISTIEDHRLGDKLHSTGRLLYGADEKGLVHAFRITPAVVRELRNRGLSITSSDREPAMAVPGSLPLVVMACLVLWLGTRRARLRALDARGLLTFGLVHTYSLTWFASSEMGIFFEGELNPEWLIAVVLLALVELGLVAAIYQHLATSTLPYAARVGWHLAYYAVSLLSFAGAAFLGRSMYGTPMWTWLWVYLLLGILTCAFSLPSNDAELPKVRAT